MRLVALLGGVILLTGCGSAPQPRVPAPEERDCALFLAIYTLAESGKGCDEALSLARLAGPKCPLRLSCSDAGAE